MQADDNYAGNFVCREHNYVGQEQCPRCQPHDADALLLRSKHAIERLCDLCDLMTDEDGELLNEITVYLAGRS